MLVLATAAAVLVPAAALAQSTAAPLTGGALYLAMGAAIFFALDKIIELLPIKDNSVIQLIRSLLRKFFEGTQGKK